MRATLKFLVLVILVVPLFSGCVTKMVTNTIDRDQYSRYVQQTDRLNTEREKENLAPVHVMTFAEWSGSK